MMLVWPLVFLMSFVQPPVEDSFSELVETVQHYLLAEDAAALSRMEARVRELSGGDVDKVVAALGRARLWVEVPVRAGQYSFPSSLGRSITVAYELPPDYTPQVAYPLVVWLPGGGGSGGGEGGASGGPAAGADGAARELGLHRLDPQPVILRPAALPGGAFHLRRAAEAADFGLFVRDASRRFHIDADRVYLVGRGEGADAAWQLALAHADRIAGLCVTGGFLEVPYARQVYPFLLDNLAGVAIFDGWVLDPAAVAAATPSAAEPPPEGPWERDLIAAAHNRAVAELARWGDRPWLAEEFADGAAQSAALAGRAFEAVFSRRRPAPAKHTGHWFRYPAHGRIGWLRLARPREPVWEAAQLSILPSAGVDSDRQIAEVIQSRLGYLGGSIEGQRISVEARNCESVEVRLVDGLVALDQPIELICNGKLRFQGRLEPRIETVLRCAREDWDLRRPILAILTFRMDGVARQE